MGRIVAAFAAAILSTLALASGALAQSAAPPRADLGPAVGAVIPHELTAPTAGGGAADFSTLVGENGLVLFFVRSVDWCPYCRQQAVDVHKRLAEFASRGVSVAFVSYDAPGKQARFVDKWSFAPTLISDEKSAIINAFGLRNASHEEGSRFFGIPHPAVFYIHPDRTIAAKLYEDDYAVNDKSYRNRPAIDVILDAIDAAAP